jgi:Glycosyltransferase family 9 (heptosyltransferase)
MALHFEPTHVHLIGDALSAVPYMIHRAKLHGGSCTIGHEFNTWVREGIHWPSYEATIYPGAGEAEPGDVLVELSADKAWQYSLQCGWRWKMAEAHFERAGFKPVDPFTAPVKRERSEFQADFVLAPFSVSDINGNKKWPVEYWVELIKELKKHGSVGVIGALFDGLDDGSMLAYMEAGASMSCGSPMAEVVDMLHRARAIITIDTGISHLTYMSGIHHHVLLYPGTLPDNWAESPYARILRAPTTRGITMESVLEQALSFGGERT